MDEDDGDDDGDDDDDNDDGDDEYFPWLRVSKICNQ